MLPVLSLHLLADVFVHEICTFSLDDLEPFLRSAETQARAYAALLPARVMIMYWCGIIGQGKNEKEKKDQLTAAVSHGHWNLSNESL